MDAVWGPIARFTGALLDVFLPAECISCNGAVKGNNAVCPACLSTLQPVAGERRAFEFNKKFSSHGFVDGFFPAFLFENNKPIRDVLHAIKYLGKFRLANQLGKFSAPILSQYTELTGSDLIIPIPLHKSKQFERGYNQSAYIAKGLSCQLQIPVQARAVKRIKATQTQTRLNLSERRANMNDAFKIRNPSVITGKSILLVDDVITTGATVSECAKVLREAGAAKVYAVSVALAD